MKDNFAACLAETLRHEGGWADDPQDPGGATMKGITIATYRRWKPGATKADLRAISDAEVANIYRRDYWDKVRGDDLPAGLDLVAFDAAVNSGPKRAAMWLQDALQVTVDGNIGPETLAAARAVKPGHMIPAACEARMDFLRSLKTWPRFGKGWTRRVDDVRAKALAMVDGKAPTSTPVDGKNAASPAVKPSLQKPAQPQPTPPRATPAPATPTPPPASKIPGVAAGAGVAGAAVVAWQQYPIVAVVIVVLAVVAFIILKRRK